MGNIQIRIMIRCMLITGLCTYTLGWHSGVEQQQEKYNKLKDKYGILELQYKRELEDCQTTLGDYQDKVEQGCFVDGGWNCE